MLNLHGFGHSSSEINGSTGAVFMLALFFGLSAVLYLIWLVYKKKKKFSKPWIGEFGAQSENIVGFGADRKERKK